MKMPATLITENEDDDVNVDDDVVDDVDDDDDDDDDAEEEEEEEAWESAPIRSEADTYCSKCSNSSSSSGKSLCSTCNRRSQQAFYKPGRPSPFCRLAARLHYEFDIKL